MVKRSIVSIGVFLLVVIVGGILVLYFLGDNQELNNESPKRDTDLTSQEIVDMLKQIFPEKEFEFLPNRKNCLITSDKLFYCIESIVRDNFVTADKDDILLVVRYGYTFSEIDSRPVFPKEEGLCHVVLGIFDEKTKEKITDSVVLIADEGEIAFFDCIDQTYILFTGNGGEEGKKIGITGLLKIENNEFANVWPGEEWNHLDTIVKTDTNKISVFERDYIEEDFICPTECLFEYKAAAGSIPSNAFIFSRDIYWNSYQCSFIE